MSLSTPAFDSVKRIDERLAQLQSEVQMLESEYGFSEDFPLPKPEIQSVVQDLPLNETRYCNLPKPEKLPDPVSLHQKTKKKAFNYNENGDLALSKLENPLPKPKLEQKDFLIPSKTEEEMRERMEETLEIWLESSLLS